MPEEQEQEPGSLQVQIVDWLGQRFSLLTESGFLRHLLTEMKKERPDMVDDKLLANPELIKIIEVAKEDPVFTQVLTDTQLQMNQLVDLSLSMTDADASLTRSALISIVSNKGAPAAPDLQPELEAHALDALLIICNHPDLCSLVLNNVSWLLRHGQDLSFSTRHRLLDCIDSAWAHSWLPARLFSETIKDALEIAMQQRDFAGAGELLLRLVNTASAGGGAELPVMLDVIADTCDAELASAARESAARLRGSLQRKWDETLPDQVSPLDFRAQELEKAADTNDGLVSSLFVQCKGWPIAGSDDPRLPHLLKHLTSSDPTVRLAASRCLIESKLESELQQAEKIARDLLADETLAHLTSDAKWVLAAKAG